MSSLCDNTHEVVHRTVSVSKCYSTHRLKFVVRIVITAPSQPPKQFHQNTTVIMSKSDRGLATIKHEMLD